jgi:hypothetical protein
MTEKDHTLKADLTNKSSFLLQLQSFCDEFIQLSKGAYNNLSVDEKAALINLSKDKTIVVSKADKGNAVIIQDRRHYDNKVAALISDMSKLTRLDSNPTL